MYSIKKNIPGILLSLLFIYSLSWNQMYFKLQAFLTMLAMVSLIAYKLQKISDILVAIIFSHAMIGSLFLSVYPVSPYKNAGKWWEIDIDLLSSHSFMYLLLCAACFLLFSGKKMLGAVLFVSVVDSLIMVFNKFFSSSAVAFGLMHNSSMDATFAACMFPALLFSSRTLKIKFKTPLILLSLTSVFLAQSSNGFGILAVGVFAYYLSIKKSWRLAVFPLIIMAVGYVCDQNLFNSTGRFVNYERSMLFWWDNVNHWIGTGIGTYWRFGPHIQTLLKQFDHGYFTFMHSDWLQVLFELGFVGFFGCLILLVKNLFRSKGNPLVFSLLASYGAACVFNMPLRYSLTSIAGVAILKLYYEEVNDLQKATRKRRRGQIPA